MSFPILMFAAGFGTRMRPLTDTRPKPLIEVAGVPLVNHALELARAVSPPLIAANLHYRAEMLEAHLKPFGVTCIRETPDILETGGGLRNALPVIGTGPVITMNTDAIWQGSNPLQMLLDTWDPARMDGLLMSVPIGNARAYDGTGDFERDANGRLIRGAGLVYGGVQILKTDALHEIDERCFSLNLLWDRMLAVGRLHGTVYPGLWCDVGRPDGIAMAEAMINDTV